MDTPFEIAAGSVMGTSHRRTGKNNQDAFVWANRGQVTLAVVCDGCGSRPHSEVGAKLGAQLAIEAVTHQLNRASPLDNNDFWIQVQQDMLASLRGISLSLGKNQWETVQNYLLFTFLGVLITPETTIVFGVGDGIFAVNGTIHTLGPYIHNAPPYLAYGLADQDKISIPLDLQTLQVHHQQPTDTVQSLLLGTDGVQDLIAAAQTPLPGKQTTVGELSQFWQADHYFTNPDRVRRQLTLVNREVTQPNWPQQQLNRLSGLLPDDTTLISIRRKCNPQGASLGGLSQSKEDPTES